VGGGTDEEALEKVPGQARQTCDVHASRLRAGDPPELRFGTDPLSIIELEADIRRVESELIEIEART
jgi:hypothetical protein